jgi:hypothetical protein
MRERSIASAQEVTAIFAHQKFPLLNHTPLRLNSNMATIPLPDVSNLETRLAQLRRFL